MIMLDRLLQRSSFIFEHLLVGLEFTL